MNELLVGYARVSTEQQDLTAQRNGLRARAVDLNQASRAIRILDWEDLPSVELGHDFHCRFGDRGESMGCQSE